jgi:hypothetical protein
MKYNEAIIEAMHPGAIYANILQIQLSFIVFGIPDNKLSKNIISLFRQL